MCQSSRRAKITSFKVCRKEDQAINGVLSTFFNTEQVVEPESSLQSGVTMLNNIVHNIEQYGQHNIVQSCFQQFVIFCRACEGTCSKKFPIHYYEGISWTGSKMDSRHTEIPVTWNTPEHLCNIKRKICNLGHINQNFF